MLLSQCVHGEESRTVNAWYRSLSPEKRNVIRQLHQIKPVFNFVALTHILLWVGAAWIMHRFPLWPVWMAGYAFIGLIMHGLANLMHEGIHGNLFRRPVLDRWMSFLMAAPVLVSASAYRVVHLLHHRHNRTAHDPDEITNVTPHNNLLQVIFYLWLFIGMVIYVLVRLPWKAVRLGNREACRQVIIEYTILLAAYAALLFLAVHHGFTEGLLHYWIVPGIFTALFANVRGWAEHMLTIPGHPLTQTRTVRSNRLLSFLNVNLNYHLEHHLFPAVPWYNLPKIHRLLQAEYERAGAFVYSSYLRFVVDALCLGVHGVAREVHHQPEEHVF